MFKKAMVLPAALALALALGALFAFVPTGQAAAVTAGTCQTVMVKARLAPVLPKNLNIVGDLCLPSAWAEGERRVDVLVHGGSYNRSYWDFAVDYPNYSYVEHTLAAGRATFAYDRLGAGDSTRPLSVLSTIQAEAYVLHQVIDWVKAHPADFTKVTVVGHSLGSFTAIEEAGTYNDIDSLVLTGLLHAVGPGTIQQATSVIPAFLDPHFAGQGYDPGYLTTIAGQRGAIFYGGATDPAVIAYDEAHKDVIASNTVLTSTLLLAPPLLNKSTQITADVLLINGEFDTTFCGLTLDCASASTVLAAEAPYYPNAASLDVQVVANTGHNLTLHPSAGTSFALIDQWVKTH